MKPKRKKRRRPIARIHFGYHCKKSFHDLRGFPRKSGCSLARGRLHIRGPGSSPRRKTRRTRKRKTRSKLKRTWRTQLAISLVSAQSFRAAVIEWAKTGERQRERERDIYIEVNHR